MPKLEKVQYIRYGKRQNKQNEDHLACGAVMSALPRLPMAGMH